MTSLKCALVRQYKPIPELEEGILQRVTAVAVFFVGIQRPGDLDQAQTFELLDVRRELSPIFEIFDPVVSRLRLNRLRLSGSVRRLAWW